MCIQWPEVFRISNSISYIFTQVSNQIFAFTKSRKKMYLRHGKLQLVAMTVVATMLYAWNIEGLSNQGKSSRKFINYNIIK